MSTHTQTNGGGDVAELLKRQAGTLATVMAVTPRCGNGCFSQSPRADSLTVFVQPPGVTECSNICGIVEDPKHRQPHHCLETQKYCMHL